MSSPAAARLLISCPDGPGIVAAVSTFLYEHGANIVTSDQHSTDPSGGRFFMRMEFTLDLDDEGWAALQHEFARVVAEPRTMEWRLPRGRGPRPLAALPPRGGHPPPGTEEVEREMAGGAKTRHQHAPPEQFLYEP